MTTPYYQDDTVTVHHGDCLNVLRDLPDASVDAVVCDPPYSLGFMGKTWDAHRDLDDDPAFGYYLAGLIDGEGCFRVQRHERGTHSCTFTMKLRADDRGILDRARRWLGAGQISDVPNGEGHPQVQWAVQDKVGCQLLVDALDKYELRAKKRTDYLAWREAVCEWTAMPRGNRWHGPADQTRMAALKARIEDGRTYVATPWSGNGFQDWCRLWAAECLRVLRPGGHMLAFGGTRTWHRLACAIEDAGFEIRDTITWIYGSGFPKSLDVGKAIDSRKDWTALPLLQAKVRAARKALGISQSEAARRCGLISEGESLGGGGFMWFETGMRVPTREQYPRLKAALALDDDCDQAFVAAEREITGTVDEWANRTNYALTSRDGFRRDKPASAEAARWQGWGTALKPASEPIVVARKPLTGTVAANVLAHGTGALNIAATRVGTDPVEQGRSGRGVHAMGSLGGGQIGTTEPRIAAGRWPSNVVLTHAADCVPVGTRKVRSGTAVNRNRGDERPMTVAGTPRTVGDKMDVTYAEPDGTETVEAWECVEGCPIAELDAQSGTLTSGANPTRRGTDKFRDAYGDFKGQEDCTPARGADAGGASRFFATFRYQAKADATERPRAGDVAHPTVKPLDLLRWMVRLVTPPGGTVLDPFAGSGTTAEACIVEGFRCITIEREADYLPLIVHRITRRTDPVANLTAQAERGEDVDLGLFGLLDDLGGVA